jgi:hypothetical protein
MVLSAILFVVGVLYFSYLMRELWKKEFRDYRKKSEERNEELIFLYEKATEECLEQLEHLKLSTAEAQAIYQFYSRTLNLLGVSDKEIKLYVSTVTKGDKSYVLDVESDLTLPEFPVDSKKWN